MPTGALRAPTGVMESRLPEGARIANALHTRPVPVAKFRKTREKRCQVSRNALYTHPVPETSVGEERARVAPVFVVVTIFCPSPILKVKLKLKAPSSSQVMTSLAKHVLAKTGATVVRCHAVI